jgi:hypothetical protein
MPQLPMRFMEEIDRGLGDRLLNCRVYLYIAAFCTESSDWSKNKLPTWFCSIMQYSRCLCTGSMSVGDDANSTHFYSVLLCDCIKRYKEPYRMSADEFRVHKGKFPVHQYGYYCLFTSHTIEFIAELLMAFDARMRGLGCHSLQQSCVEASSKL